MTPDAYAHPDPGKHLERTSWTCSFRVPALILKCERTPQPRAHSHNPLLVAISRIFAGKTPRRATVAHWGF